MLERTTVHDFGAPHESIICDDRQYCLVHLLRELEKVDQHNESDEWHAFAKKLRRLVRDEIRLRAPPDFTPEVCRGRILRIDARLQELAMWQDEAGTRRYADAGARRLARRLQRHRDHLFTFPDCPDVPLDNNLAEPAIRPVVILRKAGRSNRPERGVATQRVLMAVFRPLTLRGLDPIRTVRTASIPPIPPLTRWLSVTAAAAGFHARHARADARAWRQARVELMTEELGAHQMLASWFGKNGCQPGAACKRPSPTPTDRKSSRPAVAAPSARRPGP